MTDVLHSTCSNEKWPSVHRREGPLSWRPSVKVYRPCSEDNHQRRRTLCPTWEVSSAAAPEWRVKYVGVWIEKARKVYQIPRYRVFCSRNLRKSTIAKVLRTTIMSVLLHGAKTWAVTKRDIQKLKTFHMRCLQAIAGVTPWNKRRNVDIK